LGFGFNKKKELEQHFFQKQSIFVKESIKEFFHIKQLMGKKLK
jgi:hypothetical protein